MRLIERAFEAAKEDLKLNWHEKDGHGSNPLITHCYEAVDGFGNPEMMDDNIFAWCSCYINRKIQDAGGRGTRSTAARSWLRWGRIVEIEDAKPGDIVIFKRGKGKAANWQGHVTFFHHKEGRLIYCLGGNQSNNVNITPYNISSILGIRTSKD